MNIGDHVKVIDGVKDPDFPELELSGYTGYIESFEDDLVQIEWDKKTLNMMSDDFIELCDRENLDHTKMSLGISDIDFIDDDTYH